MFRIGNDGSVGKADILDANSDYEAKTMAAMRPDRHSIDLWERYLASYPPQSATYIKGE